MNETPKTRRSIPVETDSTTRRSLVSRVVLGAVAIALLAGMIFTFTPSLNGLGGGNRGNGTADKTTMTVNGAPVSEKDYARIKQSNQILSQNPGGVVGQDFENLTTAQAVLINSAQQDAARFPVSDGDVRKFITDFRTSKQLTKDSDYLAFISQNGLDDATFRSEVRKQLQLQKRIDEIKKGATPTDEELKFFFEQNKTNYKNEERILARQIVLDKKDKLTELQSKIATGDFATLAREYSSIGKEQDGALGAKVGEKIPQPIARVALPASVADAAFKLTTGGLTGVIEDGGKSYIVKVEKYLAAGQQTYDDAKTKLTDDVKQLKEGQAFEAWLEGLRSNAKVEFPKDSSLKDFYNPVVAKVGSNDIKLAHLNEAVYFNPQFSQFMQQGGDVSSLVTQFFKPQTLNTLINLKVAQAAAHASGKPFVGNSQAMMTAAQQYFTKDVKVADSDVQKYYKDNIANYSTPASAALLDASFGTLASAQTFRQAFLSAGGGEFTKAASKEKGTVNETGNVSDTTIDPAYKKAVFETPALTNVGKSGAKLSEVIEKDKQFHVLQVSNFQAKREQAFEEVKADATEKALALKRTAEGGKWLEAERKKMTVTNNLATINKEEIARAEKAKIEQAAADKKRSLDALKLDQATGTSFNNYSPELSGKALPNTDVEIFASGESVGFVRSGIDGIWKTNIDLAGPGTYDVTVKQVDVQRKEVAALAAVKLTVAANAVAPACPCHLRLYTYNSAPSGKFTLTDSTGKVVGTQEGAQAVFNNLPAGDYSYKVESVGYKALEAKASVPKNRNLKVYLSK